MAPAPDLLVHSDGNPDLAATLDRVRAAVREARDAARAAWRRRADARGAGGYAESGYTASWERLVERKAALERISYELEAAIAEPAPSGTAVERLYDELETALSRNADPDDVEDAMWVARRGRWIEGPIDERAAHLDLVLDHWEHSAAFDPPGSRSHRMVDVYRRARAWFDSRRPDPEEGDR